MPDKRDEGWGYIIGSRKWHYFGQDGRSLCGKWLKWTDTGLTQGNDLSPDNCVACRRKVLKIKHGGGPVTQESP